MRRFLEKNLITDEVVVLKAKKNFLYLVMPILLFVVLLAIAIVGNVFVSKFLQERAVEGSETIFMILNILVPIVIWGLLVFFGVIVLGGSLLKFFFTNVVLTNNRLICRQIIGLRVKTVSIPVDKIDHIEISVGLVGWIFRYYKLSVVSVNGANQDYRRRHGKETFVGISNALAFKKAVIEAVEQKAC